MMQNESVIISDGARNSVQVDSRGNLLVDGLDELVAVFEQLCPQASFLGLRFRHAKTGAMFELKYLGREKLHE